MHHWHVANFEPVLTRAHSHMHVRSQIHHSIVMLYVMIPYHYEDLGWAMGACMSVELNTWFLIARRVLNSKGVNPWRTFEEVTGCSGDMGEIAGLKIKGTSIGFYITWIVIRLVLYPALILPFVKEYVDHSLEMGTYVNLIVVAPVRSFVHAPAGTFTHAPT
jgi:hypothetical protein